MKKESKSESPDQTIGEAARKYGESFKKCTFLERCLIIEAFKEGAKWDAKNKSESPLIEELADKAFEEARTGNINYNSERF